MTIDRTHRFRSGINPSERAGRPSSRPVLPAIRTSAPIV